MRRFEPAAHPPEPELSALHPLGDDEPPPAGSKPCSCAKAGRKAAECEGPNYCYEQWQRDVWPGDVPTPPGGLRGEPA